MAYEKLLEDSENLDRDRELLIKLIMNDMATQLEIIIQPDNIFEKRNHEFYIMLFNKVKEQLCKSDLKNVINLINTIYEEEDLNKVNQSTTNKWIKEIKELPNKIEKIVSEKIKGKNNSELENESSCLLFQISNYEVSKIDELNSWINASWEAPKKLSKNTNKKLLIEVIIQDMIVCNFSKENQYILNFYTMLFNKVKEQLYENEEKIFFQDAKNVLDEIFKKENLIQELPLTIFQLIEEVENNMDK